MTESPPEAPQASSPPTAGTTSGPARVLTPLWSAIDRSGLSLDDRDPLGSEDRSRIIAGLFHEGPRSRQFLARFALLTALSGAIAALGVLSDSTAVVIGAMLVAPLLGPVLGVAAALVMGWPLRILRQGALIATGVAIAIGLAVAISFAIPGDPHPLPAELLARTSPNLLDLGIAMAAGAAGAYGQVRPNASDALTAVAVAVALVPPLIVVGMALQLTEWSLAAGAFYLFLANVAGIIVSAAITFVVAGLVPGRRLFSGDAPVSYGFRWAAFAVIIVALPMQFGRGTVLPQSDQTAEVLEAVETFVEDRSAAEVVNVGVQVDDGVAEVEVVLATPGTVPDATVIAEHLADELSTPVTVNLQVVTTDAEKASSTDQEQDPPDGPKKATATDP
jgi:uncharacterized hydrophobic protein (TIGR00271 family)